MVDAFRLAGPELVHSKATRTMASHCLEGVLALCSGWQDFQTGEHASWHLVHARKVVRHTPSHCELLAQVAGLLLKKYAEKFKGAPLQATYAYLRSWATDNLPANPLVSHETKVSHLRDAAFLSRALK